MKHLLPFALLLVVGCGGIGSHDEAADAAVKAMQQVASILSSVKDKATAEAARGKLAELAKELEEVVEETKELGEPPEPAKIEAKLSAGLEPLSLEVQGYIEKIQSDREIAKILEEPVMAVTRRVGELRMLLGA